MIKIFRRLDNVLVDCSRQSPSPLRYPPVPGAPLTVAGGWGGGEIKFSNRTRASADRFRPFAVSSVARRLPVARIFQVIITDPERVLYIVLCTYSPSTTPLVNIIFDGSNRGVGRPNALAAFRRGRRHWKNRNLLPQDVSY